MKIICSVLFVCSFQAIATAQDEMPSHAEINNGPIHAVLSLPDKTHGYYRGTRFDWSGVINSLVHDGHNYYGPWFNKTDPDVIDFIFRSPDIVAGPCSAISGPVEEFNTNGKALGFDDAKPGGTFIKIGVGVLRRPDAQDYNPYRLYEIVDTGEWTVHPKQDYVEFIQELHDQASGYAYRYTKTVRLVKGKPEMVLEHELRNLGQRPIESNVYDHNFLVLDGAATGPGFEITVPFKIVLKPEDHTGLEFFRVEANRFTYRKTLQDRDTVAAEFTGYSQSPSDYRITIENRKIGAGIRIAGDRPLAAEHLWSIRTVLAMEPFIKMSIPPGKTFRWAYTYTYYSLPKAAQ